MFGLSFSDLGDPLGLKSAKKARRSNAGRHTQAVQEAEDHESLLRNLLGKSEGTLRDGLGELDEAGSMISMLGASSRQAVRDNQTRSTGSMLRGLMGQGLGNSSVSGNLARAAASDANRATRAVNEGVAGVQAGVQRSKASMLQALAANQMGQANAMSAWRQAKINTILSRQDTGSGGWLGPLAQVAGSVIGAGRSFGG